MAWPSAPLISLGDGIDKTMSSSLFGSGPSSLSGGFDRRGFSFVTDSDSSSGLDPMLWAVPSSRGAAAVVVVTQRAIRTGLLSGVRSR